MPRDDGPFKILEKINDNAYKLELPADFGVSPTFNIVDMKPYFGDKDELESRMTLVVEEEEDEDITISDILPAATNSILSSLEGPMTRSHARRLNFEVRSFLMLQPNTHEDEMLLNSCDVLLLRNMRSANKPASSSTPSLQSSDNDDYMHKIEFA
jgi:hypothetical protein